MDKKIKYCGVVTDIRWEEAQGMTFFRDYTEPRRICHKIYSDEVPMASEETIRLIKRRGNND